MSSTFTASRIATGFQFTEGPVWIPAREALLFSDIPASRVYQWQDGRVVVWREPSHQANGQALDPQGRLLTCEHETRRLTRTEPDGTTTVLVDRFEGRRLNSPNDVVSKSDGSICFTDPPYGVPPGLRELDFQGVYRLATSVVPSPPAPEKSGGTSFYTAQLLVRDFVKPNGLCFSPDETILYIADTELGHVRAFDVQTDGSLAHSRAFCKVARPDGLRVDNAGNLHVAAEKAVEIFDRSGRKTGAIAVAERPANLAFGGADRRTLYITARTSLYRARVAVAGR